MNKTDEAPSEHVRVTVTGLMNVLRPDPDENLDEALRRELNEEMTPERAMAFFDDAISFEVESAESAE